MGPQDLKKKKIISAPNGWKYFFFLFKFAKKYQLLNADNEKEKIIFLTPKNTFFIFSTKKPDFSTDFSHINDKLKKRAIYTHVRAIFKENFKPKMDSKYGSVYEI